MVSPPLRARVNQGIRPKKLGFVEAGTSGAGRAGCGAGMALAGATGARLPKFPARTAIFPPLQRPDYERQPLMAALKNPVPELDRQGGFLTGFEPLGG